MNLHTYICLDCGQKYETTVYRQPSRRYCEGCAMKRVGDNVKSLIAHEGPAYDRWKAACEAKADRWIAGVKGG